MTRYRIHIGPTGIDQTVRQLDDANQSTAHLGEFTNIIGGTEHVVFDHPSSDIERIKRDLREILNYVPLTVRKVRDLYDGLPMPLATRQAVNAHRNDIIALNTELEKAVEQNNMPKVAALLPLYRMVTGEMGRTTGAISSVPDDKVTPMATMVDEAYKSAV